MKTVFLCLLLSIALFACKDDCESPTCPWDLMKVTVNGGELPVSNYRISFNNDNTFNISAPDIDDPAFPASGTWEQNGNKIILNGDVSLDVIELSKTTFILEYEYQNYKQGTLTFRFEMMQANE